MNCKLGHCVATLTSLRAPTPSFVWVQHSYRRSEAKEGMNEGPSFMVKILNKAYRYRYWQVLLGFESDDVGRDTKE